MKQSKQPLVPAFEPSELQTLGKSAMFAGFSRFELFELFEKLKMRRLDFADGAIVVGEDEVPTVMGIVLSGHLHVYDSAFKGARHLVRIVRPGGIIGASLIAEKQKRYPALVTAFGSSSVATFSLGALRQLLKSGEDILFSNLAYVISEELQASWRKIALLSCQKIEDRVLLYMQDRSRRENSKTFAIGSTETEFADYLGVSRAALARTLRRLSDEGHFTYRRDVFTLP